MKENLSLAYELFRYMFQGVSPYFVLYLCYSFPGIWRAFRTGKDITKTLSGQLAMAELAAGMLCIAGLFSASYYVVTERKLDADVVLYMTTSLNHQIAFMTFVVPMLVLILVFWSKLRPSNKKKGS